MLGLRPVPSAGSMVRPAEGLPIGGEGTEEQETPRPMGAGFPLEGVGAREKGMFSPPRAKLVGGMLHPHLKAMVGGAFRICLLGGKYSFA